MKHRATTALVFAVVAGGLIICSPYALEVLLPPSNSWGLKPWELPRLPGLIAVPGPTPNVVAVNAFDLAFYSVFLYPLFWSWLLLWSRLRSKFHKSS